MVWCRPQSGRCPSSLSFSLPLCCVQPYVPGAVPHCTTRLCRLGTSAQRACRSSILVGLAALSLISHFPLLAHHLPFSRPPTSNLARLTLRLSFLPFAAHREVSFSRRQRFLRLRPSSVWIVPFFRSSRALTTDVRPESRRTQGHSQAIPNAAVVISKLRTRPTTRYLHHLRLDLDDLIVLPLF